MPMQTVMNPSLQKLLTVWIDIAAVLAVPTTAAQYQQRVALLNELLNVVGDDESHPWIELVDTLGTLIEAYEREHYIRPSASPAEVLQSLLDEHGLQPCELPELGNPEEVLDLLGGKESLNLAQIRALSQRFRVSPAVFV